MGKVQWFRIAAVAAQAVSDVSLASCMSHSPPNLDQPVKNRTFGAFPMKANEG
jgi:hypothetical protein